MTVPVNSPVRAIADLSPLAKAIEARGRKLTVCPIEGFLGPGDKPVDMVAVRVNVKGEEDCAVVDAHRYAAELAKGTAAATDDDLLREAKVVHVLWTAMRAVDENGEAQNYGAFPGPKWMRDNLTSDQLAALLNLYNDVRTRQSPWPFAFDDADVERLADLCADGADMEVPTALLARIEREMLAQYLIVMACKLRKARAELAAANALLEVDRVADAPLPDMSAPEDPSQ
mgnify:FL=1